ncbi:MULTISPECIES: response regulator [Peribacillus]|uniref:response regulator n=1 Tax=Peribacillus TaxID=2675229 RepID=UPI002162199C|nr:MULTISPECIES: response regulator [Peribacillus]
MVITNADPAKATNQYFEMQPDCLILDIQLPAKDGFQILQEFHLHNEKYVIPKIMISIQNDKQSRIKAFKMGVDDFIGKPIDIEEFIVKMERHLLREKIFDQSVLIDELTQVYNRRFLEDTLPR